MTGIVFTTPSEATPFLARYGRGRLEGISEGEENYDGHILVAIIGIGKIKATLRVERLLTTYRLDRIVHAGSCWAFGQEPTVGALVAIDQAFEGDRVDLAAPNYPRMPIDTAFRSLPACRIATQDHTPTGSDEIGYWQRLAHVSDSTSYALAYVAATHGTPCDIVKVVVGRSADVETPGVDKPTALYSALADFLLSTFPPGPSDTRR